MERSSVWPGAHSRLRTPQMLLCKRSSCRYLFVVEANLTWTPTGGTSTDFWVHLQDGVAFAQSASPAQTQDNRKTVLCKFYDQGTCQHGDQCLYAHGVEELQALFAPNARKHRSRVGLAWGFGGPVDRLLEDNLRPIYHKLSFSSWKTLWASLRTERSDGAIGGMKLWSEEVKVLVVPRTPGTHQEGSGLPVPPEELRQDLVPKRRVASRSAQMGVFQRHLRMAEAKMLTFLLQVALQVLWSQSVFRAFFPKQCGDTEGFLR